MKLQRDVGRSCGECTGCCKPFPVPEVGKHHYGWCVHSRARKGCAIYPNRPVACRGYACLWLNGMGDESYRPDRLGAVLDVEDCSLSTREIGILHVLEIRPHALEQEQVKKMIEANKAQGSVVVEYRMRGPCEYTNIASWHAGTFSKEEEDEIRAHLNNRRNKDLSKR
ncbi:MAG: hypothetical protein WA021_05060 [Minisyncoccia bacterium]